MAVEPPNQHLKNASQISDLQSAHEWLFTRLRQLNNLHGDRPIYLLEHGLPDEKLVEITGWLRDYVSKYRISAHEGTWLRLFLPLLVVATENGYKYGGSNPEFWPPLEEALGQPFGTDERSSVRFWFEHLKQYTSTEPIDSPWSRQFTNIAWPITHAVLPRRLHVPLFQAALNIKDHVTAQTPARTLVDQLQVWAQSRSPALVYFLENTELAAALLKGLLLGESTSEVLAPALLDRVIVDVRSSDDARRALIDVQQRQSYIRQRRQRSGRSAQSGLAAVRRPQLMLREGRGGRREVSVIIPRLPDALEERALAIASKLRLRPFGARRSLLARPLLIGKPAPLTTRRLQLTEAADPVRLFEDLTVDDLHGEGQLHLHLTELYLDLRDPVVFAVASSDAPVARQIGRSFLPDEHLFLLHTEELSQTPGITTLPPTSVGLRLSLVDTRIEEARAALTAMGLEAISRPGVRVLSLPTLQSSTVHPPQYSTDDPLLLLVEGHPVIGASEQEPDRSFAPGLWLLPETTDAGRYVLNLRPEVGSTTPVKIDLGAHDDAGAPVTIHVLAEEFSVEALQRRQLSALVDAAQPLEGVQLSASLWRRGERIAQAWSEPLPPLPYTLSPDDPLWQQLMLSALDKEEWSSHEAVTLRLEASGLGDTQCWLEPVEAPLWWADGELKHDEEGIVVLRYSATAPLRGEPELSASHEVVLVQPCREISGHMLPVVGSGRCELNTPSFSTRAPDRPHRLLRQLHPAVPPTGAVTAWQLALGYLGWSSATGDDLMGEGMRRLVAGELELWLAEVLCGVNWSARERELESPTLGKIVLARLRSADLGGDECVSDLIRDAWGSRGERMLDASLESRLDSAAELLQEIAPPSLGEVTKSTEAALEDFDALMNMVHDQVLARCRGLRSAGDLNEDDRADVYSDPDQAPFVLRDALEKWRHHAHFHALTYLLRPAELKRDLMMRAYEESLDELAAAMLALLKGRSSAPLKWKPGEVQTLLRLWLAPSTLNTSSPDLHKALQWALVDQGASRAIRYAALRHRRAMRGEQ